jgi:hypothetical protein
MAQFEVGIESGDLGRAMAALNSAGIPTVASGGEAGTAAARGPARRRFLRSPALVILMVIVLAFVAQRLISPADDDAPSYDQFLTQVERAPQAIDEVTLETDSNTIEVRERGGDEYEMGYPPSSESSLVNTLRRQGIRTVVEGSGGTSLLSLIAYVLPFLLFFGFWLFMMKRMQRGESATAPLSGGWQPSSLKAVFDASSADEAESRVREALPMDGAYRVGRATSWRWSRGRSLADRG